MHNARVVPPTADGSLRAKAAVHHMWQRRTTAQPSNDSSTQGNPTANYSSKERPSVARTRWSHQFADHTHKAAPASAKRTVHATLKDVRLHQHIAVLGAEVRRALQHLLDVILLAGARRSIHHGCNRMARGHVTRGHQAEGACAGGGDTRR